MRLTGSELRTTRLLFAPELVRSENDAALDRVAVKHAVRVRRVPAHAARLAQQALFKASLLGYEKTVQRPATAARAAVLGAAALEPPRFLVRVDEFPHYRAWEADGPFGVAAYERFHETMHAAGVPYLVAVLPRVSREPLYPLGTESRSLTAAEVDMLARLGGEGIAFGLHGLDHRTRHISPRRRSEMCGLDSAATERLLDRGMAELAAQGIRPRVFVPPYNRFDASQLPILARRFAVVCGGPESIGLLGFHATPQWRGETVYLPSYPPFYGTGAEVLPAARRAIERRTGLWTPIVLHWEWEARDEFRVLGELARLIAPHTASWDDFLAAVDRSASEGALR